MLAQVVPAPRRSASRAATDPAVIDDQPSLDLQGAGDAGAGTSAGTAAADEELVIRVAISSEYPVNRFFGEEVLGHSAEEIDPTYLDAGMAVLTDHETGEHIGVVRNWSIDADKVLRGDAVFDPEDPAAVRIYGKVKRGFLRFTSVGYSIQHYVLVSEDEQAGESYRATRWTPLEVSFVAVPADPTVGADRSSDRTLVRVPVDLPEPAHSARSHPVPAPTTAAPAAAPTPPPSREERLAALADGHNRSADLSTWIRSGRTVEEITAEVLASYVRSAPAPVAPVPSAAAVTGVHDRAGDQPFADFGEFVGSLIRAGKPQGAVDPRLSTRAASGASTDVGSDGGFLIPPGFVTQIMQRANQLGDVWSRVTKVPVEGNTMSINGVDESSRATGSRWGGVTVARAAEADTVAASKPKFHKVDLKLKKLMGLYYVTEEQQEDGPAAAEIAIRGFSEELVFVSEDEVFNGLGGAQMLGVMNSPALVTVAAEAAQVAATLVAGNVSRMLSRLDSRSRKTAAWFYDPSVEEQLPLMTIGQQPVYIPQGGLRGNLDFATLAGLPCFPVEYLAVLGTAGDIVLADMSQYAVIEKGSKTATSIHARFVYDEQVIKFTTRNDGAPLWKSALTPKNGGATRSPFVTVATRS